MISFAVELLKIESNRNLIFQASRDPIGPGIEGLSQSSTTRYLAQKFKIPSSSV